MNFINNDNLFIRAVSCCESNFFNALALLISTKKCCLKKNRSLLLSVQRMYGKNKNKKNCCVEKNQNRKKNAFEKNETLRINFSIRKRLMKLLNSIDTI